MGARASTEQDRGSGEGYRGEHPGDEDQTGGGGDQRGGAESGDSPRSCVKESLEQTCQAGQPEENWRERRDWSMVVVRMSWSKWLASPMTTVQCGVFDANLAWELDERLIRAVRSSFVWELDDTNTVGQTVV